MITETSYVWICDGSNYDFDKIEDTFEMYNIKYSRIREDITNRPVYIIEGEHNEKNRALKNLHERYGIVMSGKNVFQNIRYK